jgi:hypothetical protein
MSDYYVHFDDEEEGVSYGPFVTKEATEKWVENIDASEPDIGLAAYHIRVLVPVDAKEGGRPPEEIPDQWIEDTLDCAFYGGIVYWCPDVKIGDPIRDVEIDYIYQVLTRQEDGVLLFHEVGDGDEDIWHRVDRETFERGMRRAAAHWGQTLAAWIDNQDAIQADVAVQFAIFGEVKYG